jgi:hypothetical protein
MPEMPSDLLFWSPRSDSNRRPSDYESKRTRPAGTSQTRSGCSRRRGRPASAFLTCRVMAGGMTKGMTRLPRVMPSATSINGSPAGGLAPRIRMGDTAGVTPGPCEAPVMGGTNTWTAAVAGVSLALLRGVLRARGASCSCCGAYGPCACAFPRWSLRTAGTSGQGPPSDGLKALLPGGLRGLLAALAPGHGHCASSIQTDRNRSLGSPMVKRRMKDHLTRNRSSTLVSGCEEPQHRRYDV